MCGRVLLDKVRAVCYHKLSLRLEKGDRIDEAPCRHDDEHDHGHADVHVHGFWRAIFRKAFSRTVRLKL